jgi:anti-sigma B factor antagonist
MRFNYREVALDSHLINLSGPLNISRARDVVTLFRELSEDGIQRVVVNLEDVPFVDSQGLATLIAGYKIFGSDARNFRLVGVRDQPRLVFELTGFDHVFGTDVQSANDRPEMMAFNVPVNVLPQFTIPNSVA